MYALIQSGVVVNIIEADAEFAATLQGFDHVVEVASGQARIGDQYLDGQFVHPTTEPEPEPEPLERRVTRLGFRNRFTQAELVTLEIAGLDDPTAPIAQRQQAAAIRVMQRQVSDATFIDLDRPDTRAGVLQLEAGGVLGAGRALQILDAPIQPGEAYAG